MENAGVSVPSLGLFLTEILGKGERKMEAFDLQGVPQVSFA